MKPSTQDSEKSKGTIFASQIALPKGGGAIKGIGEKFSSNPVTGTGSMSVPIPVSSGRSGFGPQLSLSYDSGSGNGPFGFGWRLSFPSITRKTDKGLPRYQDEIESDVFILSGAEDLVPVLLKQNNGSWKKDLNITITSDDYDVQLYRPRIEGLFARIERWSHKTTGEVHWRSISKDNITTIYGKTKKSRIYDPNDESHVFSWLISESYDDKGNAIFYEYKNESPLGVDMSQAHEKNRENYSANLYLKRICYGNHKPRKTNEDLSTRKDWLFEVVFDYGEGYYIELSPDENEQIFVEATRSFSDDTYGPVRQDPFSSYRAGFEVRTYRLCQRILMFHNFQELKDELPEEQKDNGYLVSSMEFSYNEHSNEEEKLIASFITKITKSGYVFKDKENAYLKKSLPALEFGYSKAEIQRKIGKIDAQSLENLPIGLDGHQYQWVDLDGEGISGILTEQAEAWYYKPNLGMGKFGPEFGPLQVVQDKPSLNALNSKKMQFLDLAGDGQLDLASFSGSTPGFYERTPDQHWEQFKTFSSLPNLNWNDPNLKFTDLNGDGHADVLIAEDNVFTWYPSLAEEGFAAKERVFQPYNEEAGPRILFSDGTQSIYLADLSGDGLSDIARIRNGEICYWPNLGYGRFGAKVTMDDSPLFESPDLFDQKRIRLADIDGSGTTDIIYLGSEGIDVYRNQAGNSWSAKETLIDLPHVDNITSIMITDLFGNGTACLVWSSSLSQDQGQQMLYIDLMGGQKPHLLISTENNMGARTILHYAPSTKFYLNDLKEGKPWITRIPFPVYVVEKVETHDLINGNLFTTSYKYHHGYFDGFEREFRGFGMVEQKDTETFEVLSAHNNSATNIDESSYVHPVLTKTWFHTGVYLDSYNISKHFENEYYKEPHPSKLTFEQREERKNAMLLDDTILPDNILSDDGKRKNYILSIEEEMEACRALKGSILRQEIYAIDGSEKEDMPYSVSERNYTLELRQPRNENKNAVFFTHPRETIDYNYERELFDTSEGKLADPRVTHSMNLSVDEFGNILESVAIGYGRRYHHSIDKDNKQTQILATYTENKYTNSIKENDAYRIPILCETKTYELLKIKPSVALSNTTNLFKFNETLNSINKSHDIPYEDYNGASITESRTYKRIIEHIRILYYNSNLLGPLKLGEINSLALTYESYKLAFTPELLSNVYKHKKETREINLLPHYEDMLKEGEYIQSNVYKDKNWFPTTDHDDYWWIPSGQSFYSPISQNPKYSQPLSQNSNYAKDHFYIPQGIRDPFGELTRLTYDSYDLMLQKTEDALKNKVISKNDYRVLQPSIIIDPNDNRTEVKFDAMGMIVGTAVMGKENENVGDFLDDFVVDITTNDLIKFAADPHANGKNLLKNASTRIIYDLDRFNRCGQPPFSATLARETHAKANISLEKLKIQISFTYSDGFGREIKNKIQAESGNAPERDPDIVLSTEDHKPGKLKLENNKLKLGHIDNRWVGKGRTIYNNKGKPVKQYEHFFSMTHLYEEEPEMTMTGVTPILFYDPLERVVATLHPNHTYEKVVFDPWKQETWDVNDTVNVANPIFDPDVGEFFKLLPDSEYLPTWYSLRMDSAQATKATKIWPDQRTLKNEKSAAKKAAVHAETPTIIYLDTLGRTFLTENHNKFNKEDSIVEEKYQTHVLMDIEGNQREIRDAKNRIVMQYDYDMLSNKIHQSSMEAGERWILNDVTGKPIRTWDSKEHEFKTEYDALRRPIRHYVKGPEINEANGILFEKKEYGEGEDGNGQPNVDIQKFNLRTRIYKQYDDAGVVTNKEYDFKGNLLTTSRKLAKDYKKFTTWPETIGPGSNVELDLEYDSSTTFDALNRPIIMILPDNKPNNSIIHVTYNESNLLEKVNVNLRGESKVTPFITNIDYNAKGQRELIEYGNGVKTTYEYDQFTFRLIHIFTARDTSFKDDCPKNPSSEWPGCAVQNLYYTYDPKGNITSIFDNAQQTVYFKNKRVEPSNSYIYDAVYRLIEASGREHIGQAPQQTTCSDKFRVFLEHPHDGKAMRLYKESYEYDEVGNIELLDHKADNGSWKREYNYEEESLIAKNQKNNCLTKTKIGSQFSEAYMYDTHGNMKNLPRGDVNESKHLPEIQWDYKDQMKIVDKSPTSKVFFVYDEAGQRVRKVEENGTCIKERIYLGSFEIYHEYKNKNTELVRKRETLHIMDNKQRIALVETKTDEKPGNCNNKDTSKLGESLIRYQFNNHLGSASLELNEFSEIISYEEHYPYGSTSYQATNSSIRAVAKRYRYTGKEKDEETGLYYHEARYYVPWLGRWCSADPKGLIDGLNLFSYTNGKVINFIDPTGYGKEGPHLGTRNEDLWKEFEEAVDARRKQVGLPPIKRGKYGDPFKSGKSVVRPDSVHQIPTRDGRVNTQVNEHKARHVRKRRNIKRSSIKRDIKANVRQSKKQVKAVRAARGGNVRGKVIRTLYDSDKGVSATAALAKHKKEAKAFKGVVTTTSHRVTQARDAVLRNIQQHKPSSKTLGRLAKTLPKLKSAGKKLLKAASHLKKAIPGVGTALGILAWSSTAKAAAEGDYKTAGLDVAENIPVAGNVVAAGRTGYAVGEAMAELFVDEDKAMHHGDVAKGWAKRLGASENASTIIGGIAAAGSSLVQALTWTPLRLL